MRANAAVLFLFGAVALGACITAAPLHAQTAVLTGRVVRDSAGQALTGAEVSIPSLQRKATTNYRGEFKLDRLPAGQLTIAIRSVGFAPLSDTLTLGDGARVDREFLLEEKAQPLDTVRTAAPERKYISPGLQEFEERRKLGFGYFIPEEIIRKEDNRNMVNLITGRIPGLTRFRVPPNMTYVGTARKCAAGPELMKCRGGSSFCPVTLYINGVKVFSASNTPLPSDIPDLSSFRPNEYAAIEYYAGGAATPVKYNDTGSGCGTLLLWTRER